MAEILVVIGIIGVVAAITIPILINKYQDEQYKTALKKAYSIMSQASLSAANANGGSLAGFDTFSHNLPLANANHEYFMDVYVPFVSPIKICYVGDTSCTKGAEADYKTYENVAWPVSWKFDAAIRPAFVLKDGSIWYFWGGYPNCDGDRITDKKNCCGHIVVDTNGIKGPNKTANDIWEFEIGAEGRVVPMGSDVDLYKNNYAVTFGYNPKMTDWLSGK